MHARWLVIWVAVPAAVGLLSRFPPVLAEDDAKKKEAGKGARPRDARELSIDEAYVRDKLQDHLQPTKLEFLEDGRARLVFDLSKKSAAHAKVFTQDISPDAQSTFRWTLPGEERGRSTRKGGRKTRVSGLKIAGEGTVFLRCWFADDLETRIGYAHGVSFEKSQRMALVFGPDRGTFVGTNFGTQCLCYRKGQQASSTGAADPVSLREVHELKLAVKDGSLTCYRDEKAKAKGTYDRQEVASGRAGISWAGGSGIVSWFEVMGKIDWKRMAEEIRGAGKK